MLGALTTYIGEIAAILASLSYLPQVRKAWPRGATHDLSLGILTALTLRLALWVVYGALRGIGLSWQQTVSALCSPPSCWAVKSATSETATGIRNFEVPLGLVTAFLSFLPVPENRDAR